MNIREVLESVPLFANALDPHQLDALSSEAKAVEFPAGTAMIQEHEPGTTMYVIVSGKASVAISDGATKRTVATLTPGAIFGEISLLTGLPRLGTVTAEGRVEAIQISKLMLASILAGQPKLYDRMASLLQKRQGDLDQIVDPSFWSKFGRSRESLAKVMRRNFGEPD